MNGMLSQIAFIQGKFQEYYGGEIAIPEFSFFRRREFGFLLFEGGMLRHKSFNSVGDLCRFLGDVVPSDVYYSCAFYEYPEARMDEKGWLGADLVFDIDADHILTPCNKVHDVWVCCSCGFAGRGGTPEVCPRCGGERFEAKVWACEVCLEAAKAESLKLLDMLKNDFGLSMDEVRVFFSGHRGYHVQVESEVVRSLDSVARKEIVDYVSGIGLDIGFHGLRRSRDYAANLVKGPSLDDSGWRGRIARGVYEIILEGSQEKLEELGLSRRTARIIVENRDRILDGWRRGGPWSVVKGVGLESWRKIVEHAVYLQSAKVDTVVTTDVHRLIRLEETLHGKTGFKKTEVDLSRIEEFDPLKEGIAFKKGFVKVFVTESPEIRVGDESFGPFNNRKVELPMAAAMLLLCKGVARVVDESV